MKYMVLETNRDFSVVLDESGRFIKASNNNYEVGQTVDSIVEYTPKLRIIFNTRQFIAIAGSVAACLFIALSLYFFSSTNNLHESFMSVYLTINPEIKLEVNEDRQVIQHSSLDSAGAAFLYGYRCEPEDVVVVLENLIMRAIDMGYLSEGGNIFIRLNSSDELFLYSICSEIAESLTSLLRESMSVTVIIDVYTGYRRINSLTFNTYDDSYYYTYPSFLSVVLPNDDETTAIPPNDDEPATPADDDVFATPLRDGYTPAPPSYSDHNGGGQDSNGHNDNGQDGNDQNGGGQGGNGQNGNGQNGGDRDDNGQNGNDQNGNGNNGNGQDGNGQDGIGQNGNGQNGNGQDGNGQNDNGNNGNGNNGNGNNGGGHNGNGDNGCEPPIIPPPRPPDGTAIPAHSAQQPVMRDNMAYRDITEIMVGYGSGTGSSIGPNSIYEILHDRTIIGKVTTRTPNSDAVIELFDAVMCYGITVQVKWQSGSFHTCVVLTEAGVYVIPRLLTPEQYSECGGNVVNQFNRLWIILTYA